MAVIALPVRVQRNATVLATEIDGEVVMMDAHQGVYFGLDAVGSRIWNRLAEPVTVALLVAELAGAFEGDPATIERDVLDWLSSMADQGLVEVVP